MLRMTRRALASAVLLLGASGGAAMADDFALSLRVGDWSAPHREVVLDRRDLDDLLARREIARHDLREAEREVDAARSVASASARRSDHLRQAVCEARLRLDAAEARLALALNEADGAQAHLDSVRERLRRDFERSADFVRARRGLDRVTMALEDAIADARRRGLRGSHADRCPRVQEARRDVDDARRALDAVIAEHERDAARHPRLRDAQARVAAALDEVACARQDRDRAGARLADLQCEADSAADRASRDAAALAETQRRAEAIAVEVARLDRAICDAEAAIARACPPRSIEVVYEREVRRVWPVARGDYHDRGGWQERDRGDRYDDGRGRYRERDEDRRDGEAPRGGRLEQPRRPSEPDRGDRPSRDGGGSPRGSDRGERYVRAG